MNPVPLASLKAFAVRVCRGESLSGSEKGALRGSLEEAARRVRRACLSTGLAIRLSPHLAGLSQAVGGEISDRVD